jgi:hypothetical protein
VVWAQLARDRCDRRFVDHRHPLGHLALADEGAAAVVECERLELSVAETDPELESTLSTLERLVEVSSTIERDGAVKPLEVTVLDTLGLVGQKAFCPREPRRSDGVGALGDVILCKRHGDDGGAPAVLGRDVPGESTLARRDARLETAGPPCRSGQAF